jgi:hypothetical protein
MHDHTLTYFSENILPRYLKFGGNICNAECVVLGAVAMVSSASVILMLRLVATTDTRIALNNHWTQIAHYFQLICFPAAVSLSEQSAAGHHALRNVQ